jgi:hypothetical protein
MFEGFMKQANEMGLSAATHMPSFIETGSGFQQLTGEERQDEDRISLFQESRLKWIYINNLLLI